MSSDRQLRAEAWFAALRDRICAALERIEDDAIPGLVPQPAGRFVRKPWRREDETCAGNDGGGGVISLMKGRVFEKVGVNISTVHGTFSPEFRQNMPGAAETGQFWASGISIVAHMHSPLVPAAHMNTRHIVTGKTWFGGGADLTPTFPDESDTALFHDSLRRACDAADPAYYERYKEWCDRYFHLAHRGEPRGVGGIFYDNLESGDWEANFAFTRSVGEAFLAGYEQIVRRHMHQAWTEEQRQALLLKRGRYVEFNLLYDRGTTFGLKTGGNVEAILMSLPPLVAWA